MATLQHKTPCNDCPWRLKAAKGWLGGLDPYFYPDALAKNEAPMCHNKDHGPDDDRSAFCVGALAVSVSSCVTLHKSEGADEARKVIGKRDDVFSHYSKFYEYHTDEDYIPPIMRMMLANS